MGAAGITTAGLISGGKAPITGKTEQWNGTSWTEGNDLSTARLTLVGQGTTAAGLAVAGSPDDSASTGATEEWNSPSASSETITTA